MQEEDRLLMSEHTKVDINSRVFDEAQDSGKKQCRICLDEENPQDMIAPCQCRGSGRWIHRKCLDSWRATDPSGRAFTHCSVCNYEYRVRVEGDTEAAERCRRVHYYSLVTRDVVIALAIIQAIVFALAYFVKLCDATHQDLRGIFPDSWTDTGVYYLCGLILFFAIIGLMGCCAYCCGALDGPTPVYHNDPLLWCYCGPQPTDCCCPRGGDCNCGGGGGSDKDCMAVVIVIVVVLAVIGFFIALALGVMYITRVSSRHMHVLWMGEEVKKYVVVDLSDPSEAHGPHQRATELQSHEGSALVFGQSHPNSSEGGAIAAVPAFTSLSAAHVNVPSYNGDVVKPPSAPSIIV